jgi:hypothetical protein
MIRTIVCAAMIALGGAVFGYPAVASAKIVCPQQVIINGTIIEPKGVAGRGLACDDDKRGGRGLLGDAPIVGNLPGLGGIL